MKKLSYIFILTVLLTACKKQHTVTIQAQNLTNLSDGSHYAGMNYVILERGYFFNHKSNGIATGQLDANGRAVVDVKLKKNLDYVLGIQKPDDVCYTEVEIEYPINYKEENDITFNYAPCAYSKLILNNVNCNGIEDTMVLFQNDDLGFVSSPEGWVHTGCVYRETPGGTDGDPIGYSTFPYGKIYYKWVVKRNGITNVFYDTVFYPPNEFTTYQIDY